MSPESDAMSQKAAYILDKLEQQYPDARIYLDYDSPLQLLVATILAARCTDERVNEVTPELFERYPTAKDLAEADEEELQEMVRSTGFYRQKTERVQECCRIIAEEHNGEVPDDLDALTEMPGVGRKTANVVLGIALGQQAIAVDTHVQRVAGRLGLAEGSNADRIESQLCGIIPKGRWTRAAQLLTTHGRRICAAKNPDCENCPVSDPCDYYQENLAG